MQNDNIYDIYSDLINKQVEESNTLNERHQNERNEIFNVIFNNTFGCDIIYPLEHHNNEIRIITDIKLEISKIFERDDILSFKLNINYKY